MRVSLNLMTTGMIVSLNLMTTMMMTLLVLIMSEGVVPVISLRFETRLTIFPRMVLVLLGVNIQYKHVIFLYFLKLKKPSRRKNNDLLSVTIKCVLGWWNGGRIIIRIVFFVW
jgi:hypothetical protein